MRIFFVSLNVTESFFVFGITGLVVGEFFTWPYLVSGLFCAFLFARVPLVGSVLAYIRSRYVCIVSLDSWLFFSLSRRVPSFACHGLTRTVERVEPNLWASNVAISSIWSSRFEKRRGYGFFRPLQSVDWRGFFDRCWRPGANFSIGLSMKQKKPPSHWSNLQLLLLPSSREAFNKVVNKEKTALLDWQPFGLKNYAILRLFSIAFPSLPQSCFFNTGSELCDFFVGIGYLLTCLINQRNGNTFQLEN